MIYLLFFLSGLSGLIYQVVWVRVFGNVFGNTIHSASIVVAVFMLGLGVGSVLVGAWADRRYLTRPADSLLQVYGHFEIVIAALGCLIAVALPHLGALSAAMSSYVQEPAGWYVLSPASYAGRAGIAIVLLTPITLLMGGTLTLLIRHLVRTDVETGGWRIAVLYGINTAGAALGCFLTDFVLVPAAGLWTTQMVAVAFNLIAGAGSIWLAARAVNTAAASRPASRGKRREVRGDTRGRDTRSARVQETASRIEEPQGVLLPEEGQRAVVLTGVALALIGFAALGMEILWFRHFSILLGGFRAVFSLLLTLILLGIGIGSFAGGAMYRRTRRPIESLLLVQGLFVATTLLGLASADVNVINADPTGSTGAGNAPATGSTPVGALAELWFNAKPMILEVAIPALLMGFSFPLANAVIQRAERSVGRRAGILYLSNTAGAVCGSLAVGFLLLPSFGMQASATVLMVVATLAMLPLYLAGRTTDVPVPATAGSIPDGGRLAAATRPAALLLAVAALLAWLQAPSDFIVTRALGPPPRAEQRLVVSDGLTELIAVTERPGRGRTLNTNGHAMSSTLPLSQRYMRALAHVPLLSMERPETVLVIGFGVGNTTHAATLHESVRRVELADLSRDILEHASYFEDANRGVLATPKVAVHINDGRQHLQMRPPGSYDLIVLEPPPIAYAGVSALYSRDFYELARTRLTQGGYVSQWLPTYQVPSETTLAMVRAFVEVFPQSVLLSGAEADLILLGTTAERIDVDPDRLVRRLAADSAVRADLEPIALARPHEIVGSFVGSARTLAAATSSAAPILDDNPMQEYDVRSMLNFGHGVPDEIVDLDAVADWCPRCFVNGAPVPAVENLPLYLELVSLAYQATSAQVAQARRLWEDEGRVVLGSAYLGAIVPESAATYNAIGIDLAQKEQMAEAIALFRRAAAVEPESAVTHWHLGAALASAGATAEAATHLARSVELDPTNPRALSDLGLMMAIQGRFDDAAAYLERALAIDPQLADAQRNLAMVQDRQRAQP